VLNTRRRVGILGGTFDPPHRGHIEVARQVRDELELDEVLLVVANDPWQKSPTIHLSGAPDRLAMTTAAVLGIQGLRVSSVEIDRGGPSFTVETLEQLREMEPGIALFLIVGADAAAGLSSWVRHEDLPSLATLVIVDRPGSPRQQDPIGWQVVHVEGPGIDIASRELREMLSLGEMQAGALMPAVLSYIAEHRLYEVNHV
jgi:nicotinate-nucleotide adenylyltransferase